MLMRIIDYRPPKIAQVFLLVAALLHWGTPLQHIHVFSDPVLAAILAITSFSVMMWAWFLFKQFDVAICPRSETNKLISTGIYKLSRNPMYLGVVGMLLAVAIFAGTFPFYLATAAYFIIINFVFCPYEEDKLSETFTEDYLCYKNKVRRWL